MRKTKGGEVKKSWEGGGRSPCFVCVREGGLSQILGVTMGKVEVRQEPGRVPRLAWYLDQSTLPCLAQSNPQPAPVRAASKFRRTFEPAHGHQKADPPGIKRQIKTIKKNLSTETCQFRLGYGIWTVTAAMALFILLAIFKLYRSRPALSKRQTATTGKKSSIVRLFRLRKGKSAEVCVEFLNFFNIIIYIITILFFESSGWDVAGELFKSRWSVHAWVWCRYPSLTAR